MDALLILGGLLLIMLCLVWLSLRAFSVSVGWGIASLVPPLGLAFAWRHWSRGRLPLFIGALGCVVLFSGLSQLASRDTERLRAILSLQWLQPPQAQLQTTLQGQLWGEKFKPEQGELINGVLRLREGREFFARRELLIACRKAWKSKRCAWTSFRRITSMCPWWKSAACCLSKICPKPTILNRVIPCTSICSARRPTAWSVICTWPCRHRTRRA